MLKVYPHNQRGVSRNGSLSGITRKEIEAIVGKPMRSGPSGDGKVTVEWSFVVGGEPGYCGIWDYKGSAKYNEWSTYGSALVLKALFGERYTQG